MAHIAGESFFAFDSLLDRIGHAVEARYELLQIGIGFGFQSRSQRSGCNRARCLGNAAQWLQHVAAQQIADTAGHQGDSEHGSNQC